MTWEQALAVYNAIDGSLSRLSVAADHDPMPRAVRLDLYDVLDALGDARASLGRFMRRHYAAVPACRQWTVEQEML